MKLFALISLAFLGCGLPTPPPPSQGLDLGPDASALPPDDDDDEPDVDAAAPAADAQSQSRVLSQTTSSLIEPETSIACIDDNGAHTENRYYRVFDLTAEAITSSFHVSKVEVAVETAQGGNDGVQPVEVLLHTLEGDLQRENLTQLAIATQEVTDRLGGRLEFEFDTAVPAGAKLAVEVHVPDGVDDGDSFYIGANNDGQSAPGYLMAQECGDEQPVDLAEIGFSDVHILIEVTGE